MGKTRGWWQPGGLAFVLGTARPLTGMASYLLGQAGVPHGALLPWSLLLMKETWVGCFLFFIFYFWRASQGTRCQPGPGGPGLSRLEEKRTKENQVLIEFDFH